MIENEAKPLRMLLIGAGGIGSQVLELLSAGLRRVGLSGSITVMDGDVVEASNLGHQRYTKADIGQPKVACLAERLDDEKGPLRIVANNQNLRQPEQLEGYDLVMVCVDRPEPRRLVHALKVPWLDVRCSGDGWVVLPSTASASLVARMTPDHEPKSCQVDGALEAGNLEFGFAVAAAYGAQWALQSWRGAPPPGQTMGSLTYGALRFPEVLA